MAQFGFAANRKGQEHYAALERVQEWTRDRFRIPQEAPVLVSDLQCTIDGCPPLQTLVAFWTENAERHHFKIHKAIAAIVPDDLPATWLEDGRFSMEGTGCACC